MMSLKRMFRRSVVCTGMTSALWAGTARAQQKTNPSPLLDSSGYVREDAYLSNASPLSAADQKYGSIKGLPIKKLAGEVVNISLKSRDDGNKYWGRITGTPYEKMTAEWAESKFHQFGLTDIHEQEFPLQPQWFPLDWSVAASGGGKTLAFKTLTPALGAPSTPDGGLEAEAVWVGLGTPADFLGRDVHGKVVVVQSMLQPGNVGHSAAWEGALKRAADGGAAAVIGIWGYDGNLSVWQSMGGGLANPTFTIPGFWMGWEDGKTLRDLIGTGQPVKITMQLKTEMRQGLKASAAFGTLPGMTDENIIVLAHMDAYFEGALDNASGLATMATLADYFSRIPKAQRRRNLIFIATAGHHSGSPTTTYFHNHRDAVLAKTVLMINCEHTSYSDFLLWHTVFRQDNIVQGRRWWVYGSHNLMDIAQSAWHTFGVGLVADMDPNASGDMGPMERDAPSIQIIRSPEQKHTDGDTLDIVPAVGLEAAARAYAKIIDEVNNLGRDQLVADTPAAPAK